MAIDVRLAADRFETRTEWLVSRHSFSFGPHYDPANTRLGALVSHNDDVLSPGHGFPEHAHRDLEIVTWVIEGALAHTDSAGGSGIVTPGIVGRLSTGAGVRHVEANPSAAPVRYLQMWVLPDADGPPSYVTADVSPALGGGGFVAVAGGVGAAVSIRCAGAPFRWLDCRRGDRSRCPRRPCCMCSWHTGRCCWRAIQPVSRSCSVTATRPGSPMASTCTSRRRRTPRCSSGR